MKMSLQLSLCLTGSHAVFTARNAAPVSVAVRDEQWRYAIDEVLTISRTKSPRMRIDVGVELGLAHARIAMMAVDHEHGLLSVAAPMRTSLVHAWVADMLHLAPQEHVIRWKVSANPSKVLVSCVDRNVVDAVQSACDAAGARMTSCRPAALSALDAARNFPRGSGAEAVTVVWTEDGVPTDVRHGAVQLLRLRAGELDASWRGWLPISAGTDGELQAAIARFESHTGGIGTRRVELHWPRMRPPGGKEAAC